MKVIHACDGNMHGIDMYSGLEKVKIPKQAIFTLHVLMLQVRLKFCQVLFVPTAWHEITISIDLT